MWGNTNRSFKSIAVIDLETTSLPELDHNTTKITELAVLGCEIDHLRHSRELPRVLHKLTLLFNPGKTIHPSATKTTGLSNELLMNVKPFTEESAEALQYFIRRLPAPICIVAHNGDKFDFPILRRHLEKVNKNLPEHVYCADSWKAFRELFPRPDSPSRSRSQIQTRNETTPKSQRTHQINHVPIKTVVRTLFQDEFEDDEKFPNNDELSEWVSSQNRCIETLGHPKSYKLRDIYYFLFGEDFPNAHRAEEDCKALLKCVVHCDKFWEWMSKNAAPFNSIKPLC